MTSPGWDVLAFTESVLASVSAGVVVYDSRLRYLAWNRFMQELTGFSSAQVYGRLASDVFPDVREYGLDVLHRRALAGETVSSPDMRFAIPGTDRPIWLVAQYSPHITPDGEVVGVVGTIHDITERKHAEELLRVRQQRFRSIIENASDMIAILDDDGRTLYESPSNERILGYRPEELLGRNALELIHPEDRDRVREALARINEQVGTPVTVECRYRHRDGSWRILEAVAQNFLDDPAVGGIVVNSRDVTDRKILEEQLRNTQILALELQLQPHFLFNTLNTIVGQVHDRPDLAEGMIVRLSEFLRLVLGSAGEQEVPLARELELLDHYMSIQQARFDNRLQVELSVSPDAQHALVPPLILQPLFENALKHGLEPRGGNGGISLRASRYGSTLELSVHDNCAGLRHHGRALREGVGLANVRSRLVQLYPGSAEMRLAENPEGGVAVTVTLPFRAAGPTAPLHLSRGPAPDPRW